MNIILSPHLDDAVFDCWELLTNPDTVTLNIFSKIPPEGTSAWWDRICGQPDSKKMMETRYIENQKAVALSGNSNKQLFLNILDKQYRTKKIHLSVDRLTDSIEKISSKENIFFVPLAASKLFRHADHVLTRLIGLELLKRGYRVAFFPDYPYMRTTHSLSSRHLKQISRTGEKILGIKLEVRVKKLSPRNIRLKRQALKTYKSQYRAINIQTLGSLSLLGHQSYEIVLYPT